MQHINRLIKETSPYLLQHAHNPVDWYPWGEEALQKAKNENKPILISIGYSACHWCHVMEKESFEDKAVAVLMNENFINIKIDREERPDLDNIYMEAVQAMTGSGGWPLNVFLTPDAKPFYGGTYFPPERVHNRLSWKEVLNSILKAYTERQNEIISQAENLTAHLLQSNTFGQTTKPTDNPIIIENLHTVFENIMKTADKAEGGFGRAPKFPQTYSIQYLFRYYHFFKNEEALKQALLSLDKMLYGGIYDQVGGGFARYSTDNEWLVPHFEKMLYDNALIVGVLSEAYQLTHKKTYYNIINQTMDFIERELLSAEGGFYSALDADSEGEEGKFYVWDKNEIEKILGSDASLFCNYYDVSEKGNWEGKNILHVPVTADFFLADYDISKDNFELKMEECKIKLLQYRNKRIRPLLDDKILLGWNALMNTACSKAFAATGEKRYRKLAIRNMEFILDKFKDNELLFHTYKGVAKYTAFLDDYAFLIQALIHLQEITGDGSYLLHAKKFTEEVIKGFGDETGYFFYTHTSQTDVIIRKKEVYDSAIPSGNSIMTGNLLYLSHVFDNGGWRKRANDFIISLSSVIIRYPSSFGIWANQFLLIVMGIKEVVVTGKNFNLVHFDILHNFMPEKIFQLSGEANKVFPLLKGKQFKEPPFIYLCKNYFCNPPVNKLSELIQQLEN
jgi:uncharacterized protein